MSTAGDESLGTLRVGVVGDVMLGRGVAAELRRGVRPEEVWGDLLPELQAVDLLIGNLECAITTHDVPWSRTPKVFHFRADPDTAIPVLLAAGFDWLSLANNHTLDYEEQGLRDTLRYLDAAGITHGGAGESADAAFAPRVLQAGEWRVALLAATDNMPEWAAGPGSPGLAYITVSSQPTALADLAVRMDAVRQQNPDLVIFSAHWGPNMAEFPTMAHRDFARALARRGVDLFHGHSAHVFQGVEAYGNGLILYDTGDFLDDYAVDPYLRNDWSFLFVTEWRGNGSGRLRLIPACLEFARVRRAMGEEAARIRETMRRRSVPLGTEFAEEGDELVLDFTWRGRTGERAVGLPEFPHHPETTTSLP